MNEDFPDPSQWRQIIADPEAWTGALRQLAQAYPYFSEVEAQEILGELFSHGARYHALHGKTWVEGIFQVAGSAAHAVLQAYARDREAPNSCRQRAAALSDELDAELKARTAARTVNVAGGDGPLRFEKVPVDDMVVSPEYLADAVAAMRPATVRRELTDAGVVPVVALDLDGTMWRGDIGDYFFKRAIEKGWLREEVRTPLAGLCARFGLSQGGDSNVLAGRLMESFESGELQRLGHERGLAAREATQLYYECNTWCFAGHTVADLKARARHVFDEQGFQKGIFPGVHLFLRRLRRQGIVPCAVSASAQWLVEVGTEYLGIPPWRSHGMQTVVEGGRVQCELRAPVPYGPGKLAMIRARYGGRPVMALGDNVEGTDREMLLGACLAVIVLPTESRCHDRLLGGRDPSRWRALQFPPVGDSPEKER